MKISFRERLKYYLINLKLWQNIFRISISQKCHLCCDLRTCACRVQYQNDLLESPDELVHHFPHVRHQHKDPEGP